MIIFLKHAQTEGPGTLGSFFGQSSRETKTVELWDGEPLPQKASVEAIVSLGGPMNVYQVKEYPFLLKEEVFLKEAFNKHIPILGICLGAQLLAKTFGAKVMKAGQSEMGMHGLSLRKEALEDKLFCGLPRFFDTFQWHEDTFEMPSGAKHLAESEACKNQAFRIGQCAWGLQFHPEMNWEMIYKWLSDARGCDKDAVILEYFKKRPAYDRAAALFWLNFSRVIEAMAVLRV